MEVYFRHAAAPSALGPQPRLRPASPARVWAFPAQIHCRVRPRSGLPRSEIIQTFCERISPSRACGPKPRSRGAPEVLRRWRRTRVGTQSRHTQDMQADLLSAHMCTRVRIAGPAHLSAQSLVKGDRKSPCSASGLALLSNDRDQLLTRINLPVLWLVCSE